MSGSMRLGSWLLGLVPLLGLGELLLHQYFSRQAPGFEDYAALAPRLLELRRAGMPVVVAPSWAEPLVRQAAPAAFPLAEVARPDDDGYASFLEVSLLGASAPGLEHMPSQREQAAGAFLLRVRSNPRFQASRFDFVSAVEREQVEVSNVVASEVAACSPVEARAITGGLHGPVARPRRRFECPGERVVAVSVIEDEQYRPRRCILVDPARKGRVVLSFRGVPASPKLLGFAGFSYFLARDAVGKPVELTFREGDRELGRHQVEAARGWARFELPRAESNGEVTVSVEHSHDAPGNFCFALEAR